MPPNAGSIKNYNMKGIGQKQVAVSVFSQLLNLGLRVKHTRFLGMQSTTKTDTTAILTD